VAFLGLKELARKFGLGDFDVKVFRVAPKAGGKSVNFVITTDDQWKLELPSLLDGTGIVCQVVQKSYWVRLRVLNILVPIFHAIYDMIDTYLSLRYICYNYCGPVYIKLNFEALRVLRQCEPPGVCQACQVEIRLHMSHFSRIS